jgi:hypothetical protein
MQVLDPFMAMSSEQLLSSHHVSNPAMVRRNANNGVAHLYAVGSQAHGQGRGCQGYDEGELDQLRAHHSKLSHEVFHV